jgi:hypothetical protein
MPPCNTEKPSWKSTGLRKPAGATRPSPRGIFYDSVFLRRAVEYRFAEPSRDRLIKKRPWSWVRMYEFKDFLREK